nr:pentatricopeptide repeat-containing protein [Quercus suber]
MPEQNVVSWNAMISAYVQNSDLRSVRGCRQIQIIQWLLTIAIREAHELFLEMGERNLVSWMVMVSKFIEICEYREVWGVFLRCLDKAIALYERDPVKGFAKRAAIEIAYAQMGMIYEARRVFDEITNPQCGYMECYGCCNGHSREALELFTELHRSGNVPNHSSFTSAPFACSNIVDVEMGR